MSDLPTKTTNRTTLGIDYRDGLYYIARIQHHAGRSEVKVLARFERTHVKGHQMLEGGSLVFSVPDDKVMVKNLSITNQGALDSDTLARFELEQSLLDDERKFSFDVVPINRQGRFLGLTVRRSILRKLSEPFQNGSVNDQKQTKYLIRAAALGRGYLSFCRRETGELICLADINDCIASICIIFQNTIVGLTHMSVKQFSIDSVAGLEKMAAEFKTIINFRLASLLEDGISIPLSALIVSGEGMDDRALSVLKKFFSIDICHPEISGGYLPDPATNLVQIPLDRYLVALGLASD